MVRSDGGRGDTNKYECYKVLYISELEVLSSFKCSPFLFHCPLIFYVKVGQWSRWPTSHCMGR